MANIGEVFNKIVEEEAKDKEVKEKKENVDEEGKEMKEAKDEEVNVEDKETEKKAGEPRRRVRVMDIEQIMGPSEKLTRGLMKVIQLPELAKGIRDEIDGIIEDHIKEKRQEIEDKFHDKIVKISQEKIKEITKNLQDTIVEDQKEKEKRDLYKDMKKKALDLIVQSIGDHLRKIPPDKFEEITQDTSKSSWREKYDRYRQGQIDETIRNQIGEYIKKQIDRHRSQILKVIKAQVAMMIHHDHLDETISCLLKDIIRDKLGLSAQEPRNEEIVTEGQNYESILCQIEMIIQSRIDKFMRENMEELTLDQLESTSRGLIKEIAGKKIKEIARHKIEEIRASEIDGIVKLAHATVTPPVQDQEMKLLIKKFLMGKLKAIIDRQIERKKQELAQDQRADTTVGLIAATEDFLSNTEVIYILTDNIFNIRI